MPLPIPLASLAAVAVASAAVVYIVKKVVDADADHTEAKKVNKEARCVYDTAAESLNHHLEQAQRRLEKLGKQKATLHKEYFTPFVDAFTQIKDVDYDELQRADARLEDVETDILGIHEAAIRMSEAIGGSARALGAGTLAGLAAYGIFGLWAAPVLGLLLASKAAEAKENAYSNLANAESAKEAMQNAETAAQAIGRMADQTRRVLHRLCVHLDSALEALQGLVEVNDDYRTYDYEERALVTRTVALVITLKNIAETPLLEEDGSVTDAIGYTVRKARKFLRQLEAM